MQRLTTVLKCTILLKGAYDKGVEGLKLYHKDNANKVAQDICSHLYVKSKNELAVKLIVSCR